MSAPQTLSEMAPKLQGLTAEQLLGMDFPPREFAIDPWLRTGESALIWAATGVGKTWLTLSLAVAIAGGGRVWEWKAPKPRKVLIIDGEMNVQDLKERLRTLLDTGAVDGVDRRALGTNLHMMPRQFQSPRATFYDITDPTSQGHILTLMERENAEVIIIDNLTTCADGLADENDAVAFKSIMGFLLMMKQAGKTAIVVHHANKSGNNFRGSTALEATFEATLALKQPPVVKEGTASFIASFGKFRGKGDDTLRPRVWTLGDTGWIVEDDAEGQDGRIIEALRTLRFVNQKELGEALGMSQATISRSLNRSAALGISKKEETERMFIKAREMRQGEQSRFDDPEVTEGDREDDPNSDF